MTHRKRQARPQFSAEHHHTRDNAPHNTAIAPNNLISLQRTIGNHAVIQLLRDQTISTTSGPTIQRLMTSATLQQTVGEPKQDKKFGFVTYHMSERYKAVITALDNYHRDLDTVMSANQATRERQTEGLLSRLDLVINACAHYNRRHKTDERAQEIRAVGTAAELEKSFVQKAAANPVFHGSKWSEAVNPMSKVYDLAKNDKMHENLYHGTHSGLLNNFGGELLSGDELANRGITRESGEGDFYSARQTKSGVNVGGGEKNFISVGEGMPGFGTALAYAQVTEQSTSYNTALYTDEQLVHEMRQLTDILRNWDESLVQLPNDLQARFSKSREQFLNLAKQLAKEGRIRKSLPKDHPRRRGEKFNGSTYPLVFEFGKGDLNVVNPKANTASLSFDTTSPRARGGERMVQNPAIDLAQPGMLKRVYCPFENMAEVRSRLTAILGHSQFEVIPMEALDALPDFEVSQNTEAGDKMQSIKGTRMMTLEEIVEGASRQKELILEAYAEAMTSGNALTPDMLANIGSRRFAHAV